MLLRLVSPVRRAGSSIPQFVQRVPADLLPRAAGTRLEVPLGDGFVPVTISEKSPIRFSLRTHDPREAKARQAAAIAYLEQAFAAIRANAPVSLTHRQATALAGELYRSWTSEPRGERSLSMIHVDGAWVKDSDSMESEELYASIVAHLERVKSSGSEQALEIMLGGIVDRLLKRRGIMEVTAASRELLLDAYWLALKDAMELRQRNALGDYRPDPKAERFPEFELPNATTKTRQKAGGGIKVSLTGLVEDWWRESKAAGLKKSTYDNYRNTMSKLVGFLKHDDALRVAPDDIVGFKDWRLTAISPRTGKPASARTVKDADLAGLKSVFGWAVINRKLPSNPAEGITIKLPKARRLRERGFTAQEAKAILSASRLLQRGNQLPESFAAKRWIPWVLAYTGARVGEIAQLRKEDASQTGDHWSIRITPEAGTVKTNLARIVPLHPHLTELGFIDFVQQSPGGHLFVRPGGRKRRRAASAFTPLTSRGKRVLTPPATIDPADALEGKLKGLKNHLRDFVRTVVPDRNVQPNHAWRHLFITLCRKHGVDGDLARMITGHSAEDVHAEYGDPAGLYEAICKLPRFDVD